MAASKFSRPVRCVLSRAEDMSAHGPRHEIRLDYDAAFRGDSGAVSAVRVECWANGGATADLSLPWASNVLWRVDGGYTLGDFEGVARVCK